jgi:hypothetical protein
MIPVSLTRLRTFVIWVLTAYAAVLAGGAGQGQLAFATQRSEAFASDVHLQVATLRSVAELEAPSDPDRDPLGTPSEQWRPSAPVAECLVFSPRAQHQGADCIPPTPLARGPPRHS